MNKDWQTTIGNYFTKQGIYRVKDLNEALRNYCTEYVEYLGKFYGVGADIERDDDAYYKPTSGMPLIYKVIIRVDIEIGNYSYKGFKITCFFNRNGGLEMKYVIDMDYRKGLTGVKDYAVYKEEIFSEPEIHEKEYLFQLFNQRLINFIETLSRVC